MKEECGSCVTCRMGLRLTRHDGCLVEDDEFFMQELEEPERSDG